MMVDPPGCIFKNAGARSSAAVPAAAWATLERIEVQREHPGAAAGTAVARRKCGGSGWIKWPSLIESGPSSESAEPAISTAGARC